MARRSYTVTLDIEEGEDGRPVEAFDALFTEYLTSDEHPFLGDYGTEAWGGYDGPFVIGVQVVGH